MKQEMSLRKTTALIVAATILISLGALYAVSQLILLGSFARLEEERVRQDLGRAQNALQADLDTLEATVGDWAPWDDTYYFALGQDGTYFDIFDPTALATIQVELLVILDTSNEIVMARRVDLQTSESLPIPRGLEQEIARGGLLNLPELTSSVTGLVMLSGEPFLVSSKPILTNEYEGPPAGTLIFARSLNAALVQEISEQTRLTAGVFHVDDMNAPAHICEAGEKLSDETPSLVCPVDRTSVAGYTYLRDIYGKPVLILEIEQPRAIYAQGQTTVRYVLATVVVIGLVAGAMMLTLTERYVLSRVARLSTDVDRVASSGDDPLRVAVQGRDEIADLGNRINAMLAALENSRNELRRSEAQNRAILSAIPDMMLRVRRDGTILGYVAPEEERRLAAANQFTGVSVHQLVDSLNTAISPPDTLERGLRALAQLPDQGSMRLEFTAHTDSRARDYELRLVASGKDEALAIVRDVTAQKRAEQAERRAVLVKEIHHRVKNNLQVISSLLNLQAQRVQDEATVQMLQDSQDRIRSMGLVHEKLYQSTDLVGVNFADYVHDLATMLLKYYTGRTAAVEAEITVERCFLPMETAVPCGLIINELVSNALKHAFPNGRGGRIGVDLRLRPDGRMQLTVCDDGRGFPPDLDFMQVDSLGMQLVTTLTRQLNGTITLDRSSGTTFRLVFDIPNGAGES
jgi:two-component sensor histidine kinase/sensor domain CHASE-containing protein